STPYGSHRHGSWIDFVTEEHGVVAELALLVNVGFDDLCRDWGGAVAVFSAFKKHHHYDFGVAPRRNSRKPAIAFVFAGQATVRFKKFMAHQLRAAGLAPEIHALQVGRGAGAERT